MLAAAVGVVYRRPTGAAVTIYSVLGADYKYPGRSGREVSASVLRCEKTQVRITPRTVVFQRDSRSDTQPWVLAANL